MVATPAGAGRLAGVEMQAAVLRLAGAERSGKVAGTGSETAAAAVAVAVVAVCVGLES